MKKKINIILFLIGAGAVVVGYYFFPKVYPMFSNSRNDSSSNLEVPATPSAENHSDNLAVEPTAEINSEYLNAQIKIGEKIFLIQIPTTEAAMIKGLGQKEKLADSEGMLFVFSQSGKFSFSMRDMNFDLDFIFIENDKVVDIQENISKNRKEAILGQANYNQVLEVNAFAARQNNLKIGDRVEISYQPY